MRSSIGVICEFEIDFFSVIFLSSNDTMISTGMNFREPSSIPLVGQEYSGIPPPSRESN